MPSAAPQPQLRKRTSIRERLKAWQKPPQPLELVAEESKPRFVYEPKHAAADFSRLAVSPLSHPVQRLPSPTHGLAEDDPRTLAPRASQSRSRHGDNDRVGSPRDEQSEKWHTGSAADRHSYTLVEEPSQVSNAPMQFPVNGRPDAWCPNVQSAAPGKEKSTPAVGRPLSDYELFIARAEAEERARREQVLRSISQRSAAAYSANRVKPDPHRQFVAVASSSSAERSHRRPQRHNGNSSRYVLTNGSGRGREQKPKPPSQQTEQQHQQRRDGHNMKGHARQLSWAPSYATSGSAAAEELVERMKSPALPWQQSEPQPRRPPEPAAGRHPAVCGLVDEDLNRAREYQPQPPRTLRRQASLTQRIAQYIRPPKTSAVRPVETLVE
ncbi:hypothetical protein N657DRAFT_577215 [Parathielavia appendiculata]|uniref:Uncharacterized protein n=1 Tax=Parathielavia appendiculata TaxID=2587402 RepID=A0AAN6TVW2_9PEZI|nr:hypothetical protein N657DRAFT_577215 [Parathielavia appendiculata]